MIAQPLFTLIDTSGINECGQNPDAALPQQLKQLVSRGDAVPFLSEHQMEEIAQHADDSVFSKRIAFLGGLSSIASCPDFARGTGLGSALDLREAEIRHLLEHPEASHAEVISSVGPKIRGQFHTGPEFVTRTKDELHEFRKGLHLYAVEHAAEIASMDHFPLSDHDTPLELGECDGKKFSKERLATWLQTEKEKYASQIEERGDKRVSDPAGLVEREFSDYLDIVEKLMEDPRGFLTALCDSFGIRRDRLPQKPSIGDAGMEAIFVRSLGLHGERMNLDPQKLFEGIRKEQLPSWVIWEGLLRKMRTAEKTTGSNLSDRFLACFGPYVDILQVDKRTKGFIKELAQGRDVPHQALFQSLDQKVPQSHGLKGVVDAIHRAAAATSSPTVATP